jgi:hypothetical protein
MYNSTEVEFIMVIEVIFCCVCLGFVICDLGQNNEQEEKKGAVGEGNKVGGRGGEKRRGEEKRRERRGVCGGGGWRSHKIKEQCEG